MAPITTCGDAVFPNHKATMTKGFKANPVAAFAVGGACFSSQCQVAVIAIANVMKNVPRATEDIKNQNVQGTIALKIP